MADGSFDAAFAYDMFTNFDGMELPRKIMSEMVRVVRPGGNVLIGSIPDAACAAEFEAAVDRVRRELDERVGPPRAPDVKPTLADRARLWFSTRVRKVDAAAILCFYFRKSDFEAFGRERGLDTAIEQVHAKNPFYGLRFNVRYRKPRA
ncbi:MAG TPA: methyltransferase domain-containing protein, partial [Vicinamibacterales bacterium]|nr:methyltransferase domain-containing protein [Vicinamibacterales bacterium]